MKHWTEKKGLKIIHWCVWCNQNKPNDSVHRERRLQLSVERQWIPFPHATKQVWRPGDRRVLVWTDWQPLKLQPKLVDLVSAFSIRCVHFAHLETLDAKRKSLFDIVPIQQQWSLIKFLCFNTELMLHMRENVRKGWQAVASVGGRLGCSDQETNKEYETVLNF